MSGVQAVHHVEAAGETDSKAASTAKDGHQVQRSKPKDGNGSDSPEITAKLSRLTMGEYEDNDDDNDENISKTPIRSSETQQKDCATIFLDDESDAGVEKLNVDLPRDGYEPVQTSTCSGASVEIEDSSRGVPEKKASAEMAAISIGVATDALVAGSPISPSDPAQDAVKVEVHASIEGESNEPDAAESAITDPFLASSTSESEAPLLSFADLVQLVENGEQIPGVQNLGVAATNHSPTIPVAPKVKKPWQK